MNMQGTPYIPEDEQSFFTLLGPWTPPSGDAVINLGDNAGANKVYVKDSDGADVATIDSDGNLFLLGSAEITIDDVIQGKLRVQASATDYIQIDQSSGVSYIDTRADASHGKIHVRGYNGSTYETYVFIDSTGMVGIGTSNPTQDLHIEDSYVNMLLKATGSSAYFTTTKAGLAAKALHQFSNGTAVKWFVGMPDSGDLGDGNDYMIGRAADVADFFIDYDNGRIGIGDSSPSFILDVEQENTSGDATISIGNTASAGDSHARVRLRTQNGDCKFMMDSNEPHLWNMGMDKATGKFMISVNASGALQTGVALDIDDSKTITTYQSADAIGVKFTKTNAGTSNPTVLIETLQTTNEYASLGLYKNASGSFRFYRNLAASSTAGAVMKVIQDHASDDQDALYIGNDGSGYALNVGVGESYFASRIGIGIAPSSDASTYISSGAGVLSITNANYRGTTMIAKRLRLAGTVTLDDAFFNGYGYTNIGALGVVSNDAHSIGVLGYSTNSHASHPSIGLMGSADNAGAGNAYGLFVDNVSSGSGTAYGIYVSGSLETYLGGDVEVKSGTLSITNGANTPMLDNANASNSNPTLIPNRAQTSTGWGGATGTISGIIGGSERFYLSSSACQIKGSIPLLINDTANAYNTHGLTIQQTTADNEAISVKSSEVGHGFTGITEADTYGLIKKAASTSGGLLISGFNDVGSTAALALYGYVGSVSPAAGAIILDGRMSNGGTSSAAMNSDDKLIRFRNFTDDKVVIYGDGSMWFADATADPTTVADQAGIYAKDVSGTVEMFAIDEAGNTSQISPHDVETGEWHFFSRNVKTGREVKVDLERFFRDFDAKNGTDYFNESMPN